MRPQILAVVLWLLAPLFAHAGLTITSFSPTFGKPGQIITVTGTGFTGATLLEINTNTPVYADFTNFSDTYLQFVVPQNATIGALEVFAGTSHISTSSNFTPAPVITSFNPPSATHLASLYIFGQNFLTNGTSVLFSGTTTPILGTTVAPTEVVVAVPSNAVTGPITVFTYAGTNTTTSNFVSSTLPTITSVSPNFATNGQTIYIFGGNYFSPVTVKFGTVTAGSVSVLSTSELAVNVPTGANSPDISVTTTNGSVTYTNFITGSGPIIYGFTPSFGVLNDYITVYGVSLQSVTSVAFNGHPEELISYTGSTNIQVYLTNNPGNGPISVTAGSIKFTTSTNFTNTALPLISDFYPTFGPPASTVTIDGINFTSGAAVKFGTTPAAKTTLIGATQISATVPSTTVGNYTLTVTTTTGASTTTSNFTVTGTGPIITNFTPGFGVRGSTVTLTGANFTNLTASSVQIGGVVASYQPPTASTELQVTVPATATTGYITVTNANGVGGSSPTMFYMQPWVSSFNINSGIVGSTLTIPGRNLTGLTSVLLGGLPVSFSNTDSQLFITIGSNAVSGSLTLMGPGGNYYDTNLIFITPMIYSFSPTAGAPGTLVTISGTTFYNTTDVLFGGVGTTNFTASTNQLQVVVPSNGLSGPITVINPFGEDQSSSSFTVEYPSTLVITGSVLPQTTLLNSNFTFAWGVTNPGPSPVTSALFTNQMSTNLTFVSANASVGTVSGSGNFVVWNIGSLSNQTSASLSVIAKGTSPGTVTNEAFLGYIEPSLQSGLVTYNLTASVASATQLQLGISQLNSKSFSVTWPASGYNFLLQESTNLTTWFFPTNAVFVTNGQNTFTDVLSSPHMFYRLKSP